MLTIGDKAPDFSLLSDTGETTHLKSFKGKKIVLYFYPKDFTPGCTTQACDFRDAFANFQNEEVIIFGISKDSPEKHAKFREKYNLPFSLLSDSDGKVCEAYDVINNKSMFGKTFLGIERRTYLIDENGVIKNIWKKVKVKQHIQSVLDLLKENQTQ